MNSKKIVRIILLVALFVMISAVSVNAAGAEDIAFNSNYYANRYPDLKKAFGNNETSLRKHFVNYGVNEGRVASEVFDVNYYLENNNDLKVAFKNNKQSAYKHFINQGIKEGRRTSANFDVKHYLAKYPDLKKAFGNNYQSAYKHYIISGYNEGRRASSNDHIYVEEKVLEESTCYKEGSVAMVCSVCSKGKIESLPRIDHTYEEHIEKQATCKEDGKIIYTCSIPGCNVEDSIKEEIIPASSVEHTYAKNVVLAAKDSTCTEEGYKLQVCDVCAGIYRATQPKTDHVKTNERITKQATCTVDGEKTYDCTNCHKSYTEVVKSTGHAEGVVDVKASKASTCKEQGKSVIVCPTCKEVLSEETLPLGDHNWKDLTINVEADCSKGIEGQKSRICTVCEKREMVNYAGHDWDITKATCEKDGLKSCKNCSATEVIPAREHKWKQTVAPNCTKKGTSTCQNSATTEEYVACSTTKDIDALGHDWDITKSATCTVKGERVCKRENCDVKVQTGNVVKEEIPAVHNWQIIREKTCEVAGLRKCTVCNTLETIATEGHNWDERVIKPATCTETGLMARYCNNCHKEEASCVIPSIHSQLSNDVLTKAKTPTCEVDGNVAYYTCGTCSQKIALDKVTVLENGAEVIARLGHDYEVKFTWGDKNAKSATAEAVCKNDETHKDSSETLTPTVTVVLEGTNNVRYTANVTYKGKQYSVTKLVDKSDVPADVLAAL